jgi:cytochrome c5
VNASKWGKRWAQGTAFAAFLSLHGTFGALPERGDHTAGLQKCVEVLATAFCTNIHQGLIGLDSEYLGWSLVSDQRRR